MKKRVRSLRSAKQKKHEEDIALAARIVNTSGCPSQAWTTLLEVRLAQAILRLSDDLGD